MKIGLLGAAFDPPHVGHLLIAQQVLEFADFNQIWFLPTYKHTFAKSPVAPEHRIAMTKLLISGHPQMQISLLEVEHQLDGNTINLIPLLKKYYPQDKFTFIIGSDNLPTFHKWGQWQALLTKLPFLVFPRAGAPLEPLYPGMKLMKHQLQVVTNISSTIIRERIKRNISLDHLVTPLVQNYIKTHHLYS